MDTFIKPHNMLYPNLKAFFTTKASNSNLEELLKATGLENKIYFPIQKHTDRVMILENDLSPGIADAVITKRKGVLIGVQVADCVPVLLCDMRKSVLGAVHAGWRGTAAEILKKTIKAMFDKFNSSPDDIMVALGPSIRWCCYNVGYDVLKTVEKATGEGEYYIHKDGKHCLDLAVANKYQALSMSIPETNIWISNECTFCYPDKYYSYRYTKSPTGRQAGFIGIFLE